MEFMVPIANTNVTITVDNQRAKISRDESRNKSILGNGVRQGRDKKFERLLRVIRKLLKSIVLEI